MRNIWLLPAVLLLTAQAPASTRPPTPAPAKSWVPDLAVVLAVENHVTLPPGSEPLDRYMRVYAGERHGSYNILRGRYFLKKDPDNPPIRMLMTAQVFPPPNGPGCSVIDVVFNVTSSQQVAATCVGTGAQQER